MSERVYNVICADGCEFESMTKEQIITAIQQAVETGEITDIDTGFITKLKEINKGDDIKLWFGTSYQYNAVIPKEENVLYIITNIDETDNLAAAILELQQAVSDIQSEVNDSGWATAELSSAFTTYNGTESNTPQYRRIGNEVFIRGVVSPTSEIPAGLNGNYIIFTLPNTFRPQKPYRTICQGSYTTKWLLTVEIDGKVELSRYADENGTQAVLTSSWLPFNASFLND